MRPLMNYYIATMLLLLAGVIHRPAHAAEVETYIPAKAYIYVPILREQQLKYWPDHPDPAVLAALGEHESCITLTHSRCWDPSSRFKTSRELGIGIFQLTKTKSYDSLEGMRRVHYAELSELSWSTIAQRPDLQIRTMILMSIDNYKQFRTVSDPMARLAFADNAYNSGASGVQKDRRLCSLTKGCNPQLWFDNVERTCSRGKKPLYGKRSACDINRHHTRDVMITRSPKYQPWFT